VCTGRGWLLGGERMKEEQPEEPAFSTSHCCNALDKRQGGRQLAGGTTADGSVYTSAADKSREDADEERGKPEQPETKS
jgi:hypothetical protein